MILYCRLRVIRSRQGWSSLTSGDKVSPVAEFRPLALRPPCSSKRVLLLCLTTCRFLEPSKCNKVQLPSEILLEKAPFRSIKSLHRPRRETHSIHNLISGAVSNFLTKGYQICGGKPVVRVQLKIKWWRRRPHSPQSKVDHQFALEELKNQQLVGSASWH